MARSTQDREWFLELDGGTFYADDDESIAQALNECMVILTRLGGGVVIGANRQELAPGVWETVGLAFRWTSFMPGMRHKEEAEKAEPSLEAVPEPAEAA